MAEPDRTIAERFSIEKATVLDTRTGLMWPRNADLFELPLSWPEALAATRQLNEAALYGYHDWKLPNRRELFSLVSHATINPCLPPDHPFSGLFHGYYWTSSTCARLPDQAWYIHLGGARVVKGMKYGSYMVWPVRVAQINANRQTLLTGQRACFDQDGRRVECRATGQDGEFAAAVSGAEKARWLESPHFVVDRTTGLTWLKNANPIGRPVDWPTAVTFINRMNAESRFGLNNWRLPHIVELESLTDLGRHSPALPAAHPFTAVADFYWSATISRYDPRYAWALYLQDGMLGVGHMPLPEFYVWPVTRTGRIGGVVTQ